jgi:hypothetical protein
VQIDDQQRSAQNRRTQGDVTTVADDRRQSGIADEIGSAGDDLRRSPDPGNKHVA